ncbi:MAG TPA: oligosaccharide flippase family protein [Chryseosolibacter sp.]
MIAFISKVKRGVAWLVSGVGKKNSFVNNLSIVLVAKIVIVIFSLATTPILTRLYSPEAYGYFAFFNALATNFAIIATMGFPVALVVTKNDRDFYNLFAVSLFLSLVIFMVGSVSFVAVADYVLPFRLDTYRSLYLFLTLAGCLLFAAMYVFPRWNVYRNQFRQGAILNVAVNGGARLTSLAIGFWSAGFPFGLIIGEAVGKLVGLLANVRINLISEWSRMRNEVSVKNMVEAFKKFNAYPRYVLTGSYLATLTVSLPQLIFPYFFSTFDFGSYSLAIGLIGLPAILISQPISPVFIKKISDLKEQSDQRSALAVRKLTIVLFSTLLFPFAVGMFWAPELFVWLLGDRWLVAGQFASVLCLFGIFDIMQTCLQGVFQVYNREALIFRYNLIQLVLLVVGILPGIIRANASEAVWGISLARTIASLIVIWRVLTLLQLSAWKIVVTFVAGTGITAYLFWIIKNILI